MDNRTAELLEFDKIRDSVSEYTFSSEGKGSLGSQDLFTDSRKLTDFQKLITQFRRILESDETFPPVNFPEIEALLPVCRKEGTSLSGAELHNVSNYIISAGKIRKYVIASKIPDIDDLRAEAEKIPDLSKIALSIDRVINAQGLIREDHPELRSLRKGLGDLNNQISSLSSSYISENKNIWHTDVPSQKEGRVVLPLKSNFKSKVKGIIHDISSRGTVLFIEPFDMLELNNKIALQEHEISIIANRIFRELTAEIREEIGELVYLVRVFSYIDTLLARARFSIFNNCTQPEISNGIINLKEARHLLLGKSAVPIDVSLDSDIQVLIITGPNAGGKTVSLKTVGLLAMMHQFGLQIPVHEGSSLPVFDGIYADIGDDQSIDKNLSTFSGHMTNIANILDKSGKRTLVLLDELGSGTDPGEGAAIAMAVLDDLIRKGSVVLTTSHHGLLKNYGYTREHVTNASMEFDENSHKSTYRVVSGVPGDSHAIDIAKRSGISEKLINQALFYLKNKETESGKMIEELEKKHRAAAMHEVEINEREKKLRIQIRENDLKELRLKQSENQLKKTRNMEAGKFLSEARKTLENLVKELREGELSREKTKKVKSFIAEMDEKIKNEREEVEDFITSHPDNLNSESIKPGMDVLIGEHRRPGVVVRKDRKKNWIINTGALNISVGTDQIYPAPVKNTNISYGISLGEVRAGNSARFSLDLRGFRLEEALSAITRQIDNALMSGLREFNIIHGKGEGVLSTGIQKYLGKDPSVEEFYFAHPDDGGFGKTIVILKE